MRRGRVLALSLLVLAGAATLVYLRLHSANPRGVYGAFSTPAAAPRGLRTITGSSVTTVPPRGAQDAARTADGAPQSFNQRLRCTQIWSFLRRMAPPHELALLCERKPLEVLQTEAPLAQAGDPHAIDVVAWLANFGRCDLLGFASTLPNHRTRMIALAQKNGASPQTVQRLDDLLAEEQQGPTAAKLEACRQSAEVLKKLQPGMIQQLVGVLGRSVQALRGENELDVDIEYTRKTLMRGDAEAEESLAWDLLQKGTPDRGAAHQLLVDAAQAGDMLALRTLAGPADPEARDPYPDLPAPERYAWGRFLQRLHEEGCFGASVYASWATFPAQQPDLRGMSPADAATAQARTAELLGKPLDQTRALLGCE